MAKPKGNFYIEHTHGDFSAPKQYDTFEKVAVWYACKIAKCDLDDVVIVVVVHRPTMRKREVTVEGVMQAVKMKYLR